MTDTPDTPHFEPISVKFTLADIETLAEDYNVPLDVAVHAVNEQRRGIVDYLCSSGNEMLTDAVRAFMDAS